MPLTLQGLYLKVSTWLSKSKSTLRIHHWLFLIVLTLWLAPSGRCSDSFCNSNEPQTMEGTQRKANKKESSSTQVEFCLLCEPVDVFCKNIFRLESSKAILEFWAIFSQSYLIRSEFMWSMSLKISYKWLMFSYGNVDMPKAFTIYVMLPIENTQKISSLVHDCNNHISEEACRKF